MLYNELMEIFIKAKPAAKEDKVEKISENTFAVSVKEPPVEGRANVAIEKALAEYFGVPPARARIISGHTSRNKIAEIL